MSMAKNLKIRTGILTNFMQICCPKPASSKPIFTAMWWMQIAARMMIIYTQGRTQRRFAQPLILKAMPFGTRVKNQIKMKLCIAPIYFIKPIMMRCMICWRLFVRLMDTRFYMTAIRFVQSYHFYLKARCPHSILARIMAKAALKK